MPPCYRLPSTYRALIAGGVLALAAATDVRAQHVTVRAERVQHGTIHSHQADRASTRFRMGDTISVRFEIDADHDSVSTLVADGFRMIDGPWKHIAGESRTGLGTGFRRVASSVVYRITAERPGRQTVRSLTFHIGGRAYEGEPLKLKIKRK